MKTFSEFFNPKSGSYWKAIERLNRLRDGFKFEGQSLVRFSTDFDEGAKKAALFRDGLYPAATSEQIEQALTLTFGMRSAVAEVILWIGDKKLSSADDANMTVSLIWTEAAPKPVKVQIRHDVRGDEALHATNDKWAAQDWGLLRLFADAVAKGEKKFEVTWKFEPIVSGEKVQRYADCTIDVPRKETPFDSKFFADFKLPEKMAP